MDPEQHTKYSLHSHTCLKGEVRHAVTLNRMTSAGSTAKSNLRERPSVYRVTQLSQKTSYSNTQGVYLGQVLQ